jgi:hypothetical protein
VVESKLQVMTKGEFLQAAEAHYDELRALGKLDNMYDYEKGFVAIWQGFGRDVFEKNLGAVPRDKRKKKPYDSGMGSNK